MDIEIFKLTSYFNERLYGIMLFKDIITGIKISLSNDINYGSEYMRVYFEVRLDENKMKSLAYKQILEVDKYFANNSHTSGVEFNSYIIYLHTSENKDKYGYTNRMKRLKEFYDCYDTLTTLTTMICKSLLNENTPIIVKSIFHKPQYNYLQKFWNDIDFEKDNYETYYESDFEYDYLRHKKLLKLSEISKNDAIKNSSSYFITEQMIVDTYIINRSTLRQLILDNFIPIKIDNYQVINTILINADFLYNIILHLEFEKGVFEDDEKFIDRKVREQARWKRLSKFIIELKNKLKHQNKNLTLNIEPSDIIFLKDEQVSIVNNIDDNDNLIIHRNLRKDMVIGKRYKNTKIEDVVKFIKRNQFEELVGKYNWKELPLFKNWLKKKKNGVYL
jgi:hypothetical protein